MTVFICFCHRILLHSKLAQINILSKLLTFTQETIASTSKRIEDESSGKFFGNRNVQDILENALIMRKYVTADPEVTVTKGGFSNYLL